MPTEAAVQTAPPLTRVLRGKVSGAASRVHGTVIRSSRGITERTVDTVGGDGHGGSPGAADGNFSTGGAVARGGRSKPADCGAGMTARILVAGIGNSFLGMTDSAPKWSAMPNCRKMIRWSRSSTTESGGCTWPMTCSRSGTRWSSSTPYPAAAIPARCTSSRPITKHPRGQAVWTATAWTPPPSSPACGRWAAVRPTPSSSGARPAASRKASG